jgi:vitamin B12 transporter
MHKNYTLLILILFLSLNKIIIAQTVISGTVKSSKGELLAGANVFIKGTYFGVNTDAKGEFTFTMKDTGTVILSVSFISYTPYEQTIKLENKKIDLTIVLKEDVSQLDAVTISAGYFEAGDEKKSTVLNSLDIVTTAGGGADIYSVMRTLPGASGMSTQTGLFVRGGEGRETVTVIDGLRVAHPFYTSVPDISARGRFNPFLFQGTYFSSGGYSAEFGEGMSSALVLNTTGLADKTSTSIDLMTIGGDVGHTHRWKNTSLGGLISYTNLDPYYHVIKQNLDWIKGPQGMGGSLIFRHQLKSGGILKAYCEYSNGFSSFNYKVNEDPLIKTYYKAKNQNVFSNISYLKELNKKWNFFTSASYSTNKDKITFDTLSSDNYDNLAEGKMKFTRSLGKLSQLKFGTEYHLTHYNMNYTSNYINDINIDDNYTGSFVESDIYLTTKLVMRLGIRGESNSAISNYNVMPRTSLAYKFSNGYQFSFAYGQYCQTPEWNYVVLGLKNYEKSSHYVLNFQKVEDDRTLRAEIYYKKYEKLVLTENIQLPTTGGNGYAQGFDLFWRDKRSFPNIDYWVSYSYLDTKRKYQQFSKAIVPDYAPTHNISLVYKQMIPSINTSLGVSYLFSSPRQTYLPSGLPGDKTPNYNNVSLNISYLTSLFGSFTVIVASVGNVFGFDNVVSYRYSPDGSSKIAVKEAAKQFVFFGVFMSFGRDNTNDIL